MKIGVTAKSLGCDFLVNTQLTPNINDVLATPYKDIGTTAKLVDRV